MIVLKKGSKDKKSVQRLQALLGVKIDGAFGDITETKLKEIQRKYNLNSDGIFGSTSLIHIVENKIVNFDRLKGLFNDTIISKLKDSELIKSFNILHLTHFLSQCSIESDNFNSIEEKLNYSVDRLKVVFPYFFKSRYNPSMYSFNKVKLANLVYANKGGNGSVESSDGYKFRGRGYIQLTLKDNYKKIGDYLKLDLVNNPDLVFQYPLETSIAYFKLFGSYTASYRGFDDKSISEVTSTINKAKLHLKERTEMFDKIWLALNKE